MSFILKSEFFMIVMEFLLFNIHLSWVFILVHIVLALFVLLLILNLVRSRNKLKMHNMVWNTTSNYIFVLDYNCRVYDSNFYQKNKLKQPKRMDLFGDLFQCKNSYESNGCGNSNFCGICKVRTLVQKSIDEDSAFENQDILMEFMREGSKEKTNLRLSGKPIIYSKKKYVLLIINDINKEKMIERNSERINRKFFFVFDHLPVSCAMFDTNGVLTEANDTYLEDMGMNDRSIVLNKLNIFENPCVNPSYKELMRQGIPVSDEVKYDFKILNENHFKTRHREVAYFRFIVNYLRNKEGEIQSIVVLWINNTLVHKTIRQNNNFQKMVQYSSSVSNVGFCSFNLLNKTGDEFITHAFLRNLGEHGGGDLRYLLDHFNQVDKADAQEMVNYQEKAMKEPLPAFEKVVKVLIDGKYHWIKMHIGQQVFDPENGNILLGLVNIDITEQQEIQEELRIEKEKAESSDKLKSAFLANMSHEIRTPLNAIVGFSDLLAIAEDETEKQTYKDIIQKNNELLLQLINDILDLAKIEANTLEFTFSEFDVNELIREIKMTSEFRCQERNPNIQVFSETPLDVCFIHSERVRLSQVINNFVSNAIKFTNQGSITVGYREQEGGIYFFCRDTGLGIKKDKVDQVFDRFVKLNNQQQGTGLGLSICQSIVEKLRGKIGVESEYGKGSIFWFFIPAEIMKDAEKAINIIQKEDTNQLTQSPSLLPDGADAMEMIELTHNEKNKILLIADNNDESYAYSEEVLKNHYEVIRAKDGEEVISLYLEKNPAIILMDMHMPKYNGFDATAAIRTSGAKIPIIGFSTNLTEKEKNKMYSSGFTSHLKRPIKPQKLLGMLKKYET